MEFTKFLNDNLGIILIIIGGIITWKSGLLQSLFSTSKQLLEFRTTERDDCLRMKQELDTKLKEVEAEARQLRRDSMQRAQMSNEDQERIRELERMLRESEKIVRELKS